MPKTAFTVDPCATPSPLAVVVAAKLVGGEVEWVSGGGDAKASVAESCKTAFSESGKPIGADFERWAAFCEKELSSKAYPELVKAIDEINQNLRMRMFMSGSEMSAVDVVVWAALAKNPICGKCLKDGKGAAAGEDVTRWYSFLSQQPEFTLAMEELNKQAAAMKVKPKDQGSFAIELIGAEDGKVVTRFPPEPSGYLHIGHAKAVLLNQYFAQSYHGKLIIRFDDTNPTKENCEYEQSILEDLALIGVKGDIMSRTSDYFPQCQQFADKMIREGTAYCDDTPQELMREQRFEGIDSACRGNTPEENERRWLEMKAGTEEGLRNCLRAKIGMQHANKALRDPVLYRCQLTAHHATGTTYKVYPTYDFACPIVDSVEGVTHALRTTEYHDRNDQYYWILEALGLRKPQVWDYSRMSFVYTLLSKRKLNMLVNQGKVSGWDDPRFPTIRGIRRRGLTVPALKEYILMQGPSKNTVLLEWDKLWAVNKKHIDPVSPRFTVLDKAGGLVKVVLRDGPQEATVRELPKHKKNADLGTKHTSFSDHIFLEQADARLIGAGEEVTLMDWGNVVFDGPVVRDDHGTVVQMEARLHLDGDFKKTEKKLTWLSADPNPLVPVCLHDYDYLITKKKMEEEDKLEDFLTPVTEFITMAVGDSNLAGFRKGDIVQLERKGYYICDASASDSSDQSVHMVFIPDGKTKSLASKHSA